MLLPVPFGHSVRLLPMTVHSCLGTETAAERTDNSGAFPHPFTGLAAFNVALLDPRFALLAINAGVLVTAK